ncbi:MAG TPA: glutathione S-transferase [Solimonas sp.]
MSALTLVIGSKTFSSWSLRPWLLLQHHQVPFQEVLVALNANDTRARILEHSPSGKVPLLRHGERRIWESLAICEYAAETLLLPAAWPMDPDARAFARAASAEMHAGFADLRSELPFEIHREPARKACSARAAADIARIRALWREARTRFGRGGDWLCGRFGIVDAMFAPVALRFFVYDVALDGPEREYMKTVLMHPAVQAWMAAAKQEQSSTGSAPPATPDRGAVTAAARETGKTTATTQQGAAPSPAKPAASTATASRPTAAAAAQADAKPAAKTPIRSVVLPPD